MAGDTVYADLLDALSPVSKAGMDPDAAAADRAGTMAKLLGPDDKPKANWYDPPTEEAQNVVPALPDGLQRRPGTAQPAQATPAVPAGVTPSASPTKPGDLATQNAATIGLGQTAYAQSLKDVDAMAAAPTEDQDPAVIKAQTAAANYAVPTNPYAKDPTTGKPLYSPSVMQRIARGVSGFARGSVLGVLDPGAFGGTPYGAPNSDYDYTEKTRPARETLAVTQLKQAQDAWTAAQGKAKTVQEARATLATTGLADATKPSVDQQEVPIHQQTADAATQTADAAKSRATTAAKPKPVELPKTEDEAIAAANAETDPVKQAGYRSMAKDMHTAHMQERPPVDRSAATDAKAAKNDDDAQSIVADFTGEKQKWVDSLYKNSDGTYLDGQKILTQKNIDEKIDQFRRDGNVKLAKLGYQVDDQWNMKRTNQRAATPAAAQPAQPKPAQSAPKPPKVGQVVKGYVFQGGDPSSRSSWKPVRK